MNIIIASRSGVHPNTGGIERVSWDLATEFIRQGHNAYFLSSTPVISDIKLEREIVNFYLPNSNNDDCSENIEYIKGRIDDLSIDIVLNQSANIRDFSMAVIKACAGRCKIISALHFNPRYHFIDIEDSYFVQDKLGANILKWSKAIVRYVYYKLYYFDIIKAKYGDLYRSVYDKSDAYVLLSDEFTSSFIDIAELDNKDKLISITNPSKSATTDIETKEKIILFVGRIERAQKRVDRLLPIWKLLYTKFPNWKLVVCGDGNFKSQIESIALRENLKNIEFKGIVSPNQYYKKSSVLLMTSSFEGFGLVLLEAQQQGCIPIAYNSFESVTDIIDDGKDGLLVTPFNQDEYVTKLRKLMRDEEYRSTLINNCRTKDYSKFDVTNVADQWIKLFEEVVNIKN